ncbi:septal ring lytic transglycosylase RlpA family protein [Deinococcus sp.]|uniref:septal ring lytic transglycosylase RlpA family protein n=1 Tax=Deinococcus sp. TaxID=47478 RepID=UPI003C7B87F1
MRGRRAVLLALTLLGPAGAERVYRVRAGDSLFSLAHGSGVTVQALQRLNGLSGSQLRVGQALKLPDGATGGFSPAAQTSPVQAPAIQAVQTPPAQAAPVFQRGMAVYYGGRLDNRTVLTAAHLSLPFGTWVEVTHARTGRSVLVLINDRGPFGQPERVIDLSAAAAQVLGITGEGVAPVTLRIARQP